jgi:hypothetical protein
MITLPTDRKGCGEIVVLGLSMIVSHDDRDAVHLAWSKGHAHSTCCVVVRVADVRL